MPGYADTDLPRAGRQVLGQPRLRFEDKRDPARPEPIHQPRCNRRHFCRHLTNSVPVGYQNQQGIAGGALFDGKNSVHSHRIPCVRAQTVQTLGRKNNDPAPLEEPDGP